MTFASTPQFLAFISNSLDSIAQQLRHRNTADGLPGMAARPLMGRPIKYRRADGSWNSIHTTYLSLSAMAHWSAGAYFDVVDLFTFKNGELYRVLQKHTSSTIEADIARGVLQKVSGFDADLGDWAPVQAYEKGYMLEFNGQLIQATTNHVSSEQFSTDAQAGYWEFLANTKITTTTSGQGVYSFQGQAVDDTGKLFTCVTSHDAVSFDAGAWSGGGAVAQVGQWAAVPTYTVSTGRTVSSGQVLLPEDMNTILMVDTSAGSFSLDLVAAPAVGDTLYLADAAQSWDTHPLLLGSNKYFSTTSTYAFNTKGAQVQLTYRGTGIGWTVLPIYATTTAVSISSLVTARTVSSATQLQSSDQGKAVVLDSRAGSFQIQLPGAPAQDETYYLQDGFGSLSAYPVSLGTNNYYGRELSLTLNQNQILVSLTYRGVAAGWVVTPLVQTPGAVRFTPSMITGRQLSADAALVASDFGTAVGVSTTGGIVQVSLPTNPQVDDSVALYDPHSSWAAYPVVVAQALVFGRQQSMTLNTDGGYSIFTYRGGSVGWTMRASDSLNYTTINRGLLATGRLITGAAQLDTVTDANKVVLIDSSAGSFELQLPANPQVNQLHYLQDATFSWGVHPVTLSLGTYFSHVGVTMPLDVAGGCVALVYRGEPVGWTIGHIDALADPGPLQAIMGLKADKAEVQAEAAARNLAVGGVQSQVTALAAQLAQTDTALAQEATTRAAAITAGAADLALAVTTLQAADAAQATATAQEVSDRIAAVAAATQAIALLQTAVTNLQTNLAGGLSQEATDRTAAIAALNAALSLTINNLSLSVSNLSNDLSTLGSSTSTSLTQISSQLGSETLTRATQYNNLTTALNAEVNTRQTAVSDLALQQQTETAARLALVDSVNAAFASEAQTRQAADTAATTRMDGLANSISAEGTARLTKEALLDSAIANETTDRTAAIAALTVELDALTLQVTNLAATVAAGGGGGTVDPTLITDITTRLTAAEAAIVSLNASMSQESTARSASDTALLGGLNAEILARQSDVQALTAAQSTETTARVADVTKLTGDLAAEVTARTTAVAAAVQATADETAARIAAVAAVQSAVDAEVTARTAAVTAEATDRGIAVGAVAAGLTQEVADRTAAVAAVAASVTTETDARTAAIAAVVLTVTQEAATRSSETAALAAADLTEKTARESGDAANAAAIASEATTRAGETAALSTAVTEEVAVRTSQISAVNTAIAQEVTDRAAAVAAANAAITTESTTRAAQVAALTTAQSDETTARVAAIAALTTAQSTEVADRTAAVAALRTDLNTEINARTSDVAALTLSISNEVDARTAAITAVNTAATAEVNARTAAIAALQTQFNNFVAGQGMDASAVQVNLDAEILTRSGETSSLRTDLNSEISTRAGLTTGLRTDLNSEINARAGAITQVQTNIDNEATTRAGQVSTLTTDLASEVTTRSGQVSTLTTNLNAEITARTALTDALATADSNEAATRAAADTANAAAITAEAAARATAISGLQTSLDNEVTARTTADTNETTARTAADTALQNQITAITPYYKDYAVAPATNVNVELSLGSTAPVAGTAYRLKIVTQGTATISGAVYLLTASAAGTWVLTPVTRNILAGGNNPQLSLSGSVVQLFHNHATLSYNIRVLVEAVVHGNATAASPLLFGMDGVLAYEESTSTLTLKQNTSATNLAYTGTLTGGTGVVNLGSGQFYKDAAGNIGIGTTTLTGLLTTKTALNTVQQHTVQADSGTANGKMFGLVINRFNFDSAGTAAEINVYRGGNGFDGEIEFATNPGSGAGAAATARLRITSAGHLKPMADNTYTSGLATNRWSTVYGVNLDYTGTLTGGTGVVNLGSGQFYKDATGNVTIGSTNVYSLANVEGAASPVTGNAQRFLLSLVDTTAVAAGVGGGIVFFGNSNGTTKTGFAGVQGVKENATAGDTAGAFIITTRVNGANLAEVARYTSAGHHLPKTTAAQDQGSSTLRWNNQWMVNADYSGTLTGGTGIVNIGSGQLYKDTSGRVILGNTSAAVTDYTATAVSALQLQGLTDSTASGAVVRYSADVNPSRLYLAKSRGATVGSAGLVAAGDALGELGFLGHDGSTGFRRTVYVRAVAEQTPAANDIPAGLAIGVSYAAAGTWNEAWRFDSFGRLYAQQAAVRAINVANSAGAGAVNLLNLETVRSSTWPGVTAVMNTTTAALGPTIALARTRGTAVGDVIAVQSGDGLGGVTWSGADGTNIRSTAAEIFAVAAAAPSTGSLPGKLYVATTGVGGTSPTRRALWDEAGHYLPATTAAYDVGSTTLRWKGAYATTLDISTTSTLTGNVTMGGTLTVAGAVTLTSGLSLAQVKDDNGAALSDDTIKNNLLSAPTWGTVGGIWNPYGVQGVNGSAWVTMPNGEQGLVWTGDSTIGNLNWFAGPISSTVAIKNDRTYRLLLPVRRTSANTDSQLLYVGATAAAGTVDNLNTSTTNANPYFATLNLVNMVQNKWYLVEAYIYPAGVTGLTNTGAVYDMDTGARVGLLNVLDFNWDAAATTFRLRSGLYKSTAATQVASVQWGKPRFEVMDGAESDPTMLFATQGQGNNLGLVGTNVTIRGNKIFKTGGVNATWDAGAYSKVGYTNGCYLRMRISNLTHSAIFGLNSDPATDANYTGIDFAFYISGSASLNIRESANAIDAVATGAIGDILTIIYDGDSIVYQVNGSVIRTVAANITVPLYFDCSLYNLNASCVEDVEFGPLNSVNNSSNMLEDLFDLPTQENAIQYLGSSYETVSVTAVADVAGSLAGKYFRLYGAGGTAAQINPSVAEQIIDVWFQVSGVGTQPVSGASRWVQVNIANNDTAITIAAAVAAAMATDVAYQTVGTDGAGAVIFVASTPANHTAATAGTSGFTVATLTNGSGALSGGTLYAGGGLAPNGRVYAVPYNATSVMTIDPDTGVTTTFGSLAGTTKYVGMSLARDGKFYCPPASAGNVLVIDPANNTTYTIGSGLGQYRCAALAPNGKIYSVSMVTGNILVIDPATQTVSTIGSGLGSYYGILLGMDGKLYGIPADATSVLCIDPLTNTYTTFGSLASGGSKYVSGTLAQNGKIYCAPFSATSVLVIDPATKTISTFGNLAGANKWGSSRLGANGKIYALPRAASSILVIDPEQNTTTQLGNFSSAEKWIGTVLAPNGKLIGLPFNALYPIAVGGGNTAFPAWYLSAHFNNS